MMTSKYLLAVLTALAVSAIFTADASAMYNAPTGRWLQRDPIRRILIDNLYQYARSSPLSLADPSGLITTQECDENFEKEYEAARLRNLDCVAGLGASTSAGGVTGTIGGFIISRIWGCVAGGIAGGAIGVGGVTADMIRLKACWDEKDAAIERANLNKEDCYRRARVAGGPCQDQLAHR